MPSENRKKSFYFEVSKKVIILIEVCVCPDVQCTKRSQQYKWFSDVHLLKLLEKLKDICLARVLLANSSNEQDIQDVSEIVAGASSYFHMMYTFKKRGIKQFLVMQATRTNENKGDEICNYSGGGHKEFHLFPERLKVFVSLAPIKFGSVINQEKISVNKGAPGSKIAKQEKKMTVKEKSKYFAKDKDGDLTLSAVKKQANLRSIIQKMKDTSTDAVKNVAQYKQDQNLLDIPSYTADNTCKPEDQEKESSCNSTVNMNVEYARKRSREEAGLNEDLCTGSDSGSEEQHSKDNDCDQSDFVIKKPLTRKKRIKHTDRLTKDKNTMEPSKSKRKNNPSQEVVDTASTSTVNEFEADNRRIAKKDEKNPKELKTPAFVDLRENEKWSGSIVTNPSLKENERVVVEDKVEGRHCESITIDDAVPSFDNVKKISDLGNNHIRFLVQKLEKKLKAIFMGKEYCRRHEDYKRGGRSKGDLAFQVRFGLYSEEQQEAIMRELMSIFCSRHNKYLDYLTKVLLPETFIRIYIELFGGNHDEVEHILMGNERQKEIQTDGSSTE